MSTICIYVDYANSRMRHAIIDQVAARCCKWLQGLSLIHVTNIKHCYGQTIDIYKCRMRITNPPLMVSCYHLTANDDAIGVRHMGNTALALATT